MAHEPPDYTRYEHLIALMKTKSLDVYFVQETWLEGDIFDEIINGYHIFRHNGGKSNHNFRGVAIILSPRYHEGWKAAGARPPMTTDAAGEFAGRYISINVILNSRDRMGKQVHGKKGRQTSCINTRIRLSPVYQDRLRGIICSLPRHTGYSPQQTPSPQQNYHGYRRQCQHRQV